MPLGTLRPSTFASNNINDGTIYQARFVGEDGGLEAMATHPADAIQSDRPDAFPVHVRTQPSGLRLHLEVTVLTETRANVEQLKKWFDPMSGEQLLVVLDDDDNQRRILCAPESVIPVTRPPKQWHIVLAAASGHWESATLDSDTEQITASGQTFAIDNDGNAKSPIKFTISPQAVKGNGNHYIRYRHLVLANRSERPYTDPIGVGWPVDVFNNAFDAAAEVTATQMQSDGGDLRIVNNGVELHRWLDPSTMNANQRGWVNLQFRPMKRVTLGEAFANGSTPAAGSTFELSNAQGTRELPTDSFLLIGTECVHVEVIDGTTCEVKERGALGTTAAAHSAGDYGYWVEHPYLIAVYDYSAVANPSPPDDEKPLIDLANSRNNKMVYSSTFLVPSGTRRSGGWQPEYSDDGPTSAYVRVYENSNTLVFEDALPVAGKPNYNNVVLSPPAGIKAAAAAVELDFTIGNNVRLHGYLLDREGHESRLINEEPQSAQTNQQYEPGQVSDQIRLNGRIGSVMGNNTGSTTAFDITDVALTHAFSFVIDEETRVTHVAFKLENSGGGSSSNISYTIVPDEGGLPATGAAIASGSVPNASIPTSPGWVVDATEAILPPGNYWLTLQKTGTINGTINAFRTTDRTKGRSLLLDTITARGSTGEFLILTDDTPPQYDAALETGDDIVLDNIEITLDDSTPRTLLCVLGAERNLYWLNARLKNDTTGKYLDFSMPMLLGESLEVDCSTRLVTYGEHERRVPWTVMPSHPAEWLQLVPGTNTFSFTETGVNDTDVAWEKRDRFL